MLANPINIDLRKGFTVSQVAEKHGWPEPLVWALKLEGKDDLDKCKELQWEIRPWNYWEWFEPDKRFGDEWPERLPAQIIANILYFFSEENDPVFDPMAGENSKKSTRPAMICAYWRDFWNTPAMEEIREKSILINDYAERIENAGWRISDLIQAPMLPEKYQGEVAAEMEKMKILGVTARHVVVAEKAG
ncbi:MAG: hypothetical protein PVG39_20430 [Desulfobacteraceae bacterium]|jgi:hypothetical protein